MLSCVYTRNVNVHIHLNSFVGQLVACYDEPMILITINYYHGLIWLLLFIIAIMIIIVVSGS